MYTIIVHPEELKEMKEILEINDTQAEGSKSQQPPKYAKEKTIYLVLLEAAMRYREAYYREELDMLYALHKEAMETFLDNNKISYSKEKKIRQQCLAEHKTREVNYQRFNQTVMAEIEANVKGDSLKMGTPFDNYAASFGLLANEFVGCKNTTELLTLAKSYNDGLFDDALAFLKNNDTKKEDNG